ncbi:MAG: dihydropyrimidinase [Bacteroidales bacterium]|nr:dihydropyrimidinase [Bacteroidales bacterium]
MKILIKGGTIVTSTEQFNSDVLIEDEKIIRIDKHISENHAERVIHAENQYVFPGGIDPHVHLYLPTPAGYSSDDFLSGGIAALYGGTTTIIDFVTPKKNQPLPEALNIRIDEAKNCPIDYSFHVSPVDWRPNSEKEIEQCIDMGFPSFKIYLAYKESIGLDDESTYHVMKAVGKLSGMVTAHCELGDEVSTFRDFYYNQKMVSPLYHMLSRSSQLESIAVKRIIDIADQTNCSLYIVHVSAGDSLKHIHLAQQSGQPIFAETCPQYLLLDESKYYGEFEQTAKYVISPPLRKPEDSAHLWEGIKANMIQTVGTDHCPFSFEQKSAGKDDFRKIPNGAGGIEHRLELLYTYGVLKDIISLNRMVDIFSTQPAKIFGLYPQKGEIAVGSDADIVVWNPNTESVISAKTHHSKVDMSIYEGFSVKGKAQYVISKGIIGIDNGKIISNLPTGKLLRRKVQKTSSPYYSKSNDVDNNNCGRV